MSQSTEDVAVRLKLEKDKQFKSGMDASGRAVRGLGKESKTAAGHAKHASHEFGAFESGLHKFRHVVGLAAGVTGLAALASGMHEVISSSVQSEAAMKGVENSVRNAKISWKNHREEIERNLDKQTLFAGIQKSDVAASYSNMIRSTGNSTKAFKLNSLAIDIAHKKNMGLANAQSLVARVYNGSFMGLKRLGIQIIPITRNQDELRKSVKHYTVEQMRAAKAADARLTRDNALRIATDKFKGSTDAWGKSAQGSAARARVAIELAQEQIGNLLLPSIAKGAQAIAKLAMKFTEHWPQIKAAVQTNVKPIIDFLSRNRAAILGVSAALAAGVVAFKAYMVISKVIGVMKTAIVLFKAWRAGTLALTTAQLGLDAALVANPIGLVIAAIAALAVGLFILYKRSSTVRNALRSVWATLKSLAAWIFKAGVVAVKALWKVFTYTPTGFVLTHLRQIINFVQSMPHRISKAARGMWDGLKNAFRGAINWIIRGWNGLQFKMPSINTHIPHIGKIGGFTVGVPDIPLLANGGNIMRSGSAIVGDNGPELLHLDRGAQVQPLAAGGNFDVHVYIADKHIDDAVYRVTKKRMQRR